MADEAAKHPNLPSSLEHTMAVNSVTEAQPVGSDDVNGYLALNGCTNFGGHTFISIPSGAVALMEGMSSFAASTTWCWKACCWGRGDGSLDW